MGSELWKIVRADEIKAGDVFLDRQGIRRKAIHVELFPKTMIVGTEFDEMHTLIRASEVARIEPDPIKVRVFWKLISNEDDNVGDQTYGGLSWEAETAEAARVDTEKMLNYGGIDMVTIEHTRETILSREVKRR